MHPDLGQHGQPVTHGVEAVDLALQLLGVESDLTHFQCAVEGAEQSAARGCDDVVHWER